MTTKLAMDFSVDKENKKITVKKQFSTSLSKVWDAWTKSDILDQWWAPKPWRAETKTMNFKEGGYWLYAMVGPEGEKHWARADYKSIKPQVSFSIQDAFCDENGTINNSLPKSFWTNKFSETSGSTTVSIEIQYNTLKDLEETIKMGFKEGFTMALENLESLFANDEV